MPENWKTYKLKDVALLKRGYDLPSRLRKTGEYDIISSSGVVITDQIAPGISVKLRQ